MRSSTDPAVLTGCVLLSLAAHLLLWQSFTRELPPPLRLPTLTLRVRPPPPLQHAANTPDLGSTAAATPTPRRPHPQTATHAPPPTPAPAQGAPVPQAASRAAPAFPPEPPPRLEPYRRAIETMLWLQLGQGLQAGRPPDGSCSADLMAPLASRLDWQCTDPQLMHWMQAWAAGFALPPPAQFGLRDGHLALHFAMIQGEPTFAVTPDAPVPDTAPAPPAWHRF